MRGFRRGVACNASTLLIMILKPEKTIKRIIKAVGQRQAVLLIGEWQEELTKGIKKNQNVITIRRSGVTPLLQQQSDDNAFTRIVADYSTVIENKDFFTNGRRLLLPTGFLIITANCELNIFEKLFQFLKPTSQSSHLSPLIKPKTLQNQIHDNGFLIDGYYGYPGGHLIMIAQIINKEVTTLFTHKTQETIVK